MQADAVDVWKTNGRKRMRPDGPDAPTVLTCTAEKSHPVAEPVPARKALPNQPAERPAQQHQQQRSDTSRSAQPGQLQQQQQQAQCDHEHALAQHAKQDGMASVPQKTEQARQKSCELPQQVQSNTAADRAQHAKHAQQAPLTLDGKATGHAQQAQHAQQQQPGRVSVHRQQTQRAQQHQHTVSDKPGQGAGQAQHAQQPQKTRPLAPLQADQRPTPAQVGIGQSRAAASPQTRDVSVDEGQMAVQSSGSELRVKRSLTAGDANEPNKRHKVPYVQDHSGCSRVHITFNQSMCCLWDLLGESVLKNSKPVGLLNGERTLQ